MLVKVEITVEDSIWLREDRLIKSKLKKLIKIILPQTILANYLPQKTQVELSLLLTGDQKITELNHNYRKKSQPTNVLAFPTINTTKSRNGNLKELPLIAKLLPLGDIILSYQTIKKEAELENKKFINHLAHLVIHALLHLLGYDHIKSKDAKIMMNLEIELLKKLDIDNPYII